MVIHELILAIGIDKFVIRINNRQVLTAFLRKQGLEQLATPVLRALDKFEKVGGEQVLKELEQNGLSSEQANGVLGLASITGTYEHVLRQLDQLLVGDELGQNGVARLNEIAGAMLAAGVPAERFRIDVSIARGLDYYTGVIFETILNDLPNIGSICSGGRYDNLAGLYTKQQLPGIGASLGLDRLLAALEQLGHLPSKHAAADVFIALFDPTRLNDYFQLAKIVRAAGFSAEVYPEEKKLAQQLKYADQRCFPLALIAGSRELDEGKVQIKNLMTKTATEVSWRNDPDGFVEALRNMMKLGTETLLA